MKMDGLCSHLTWMLMARLIKDYDEDGPSTLILSVMQIPDDYGYNMASLLTLLAKLKQPMMSVDGQPCRRLFTNKIMYHLL